MAGKPTFYWDACIFYEWIGKETIDSRKKAAIDELIAANEKKENLIITSAITHLEVLPEKLTEKGAEDEQDYLALFDGVHFHDVEVSTNILLRAREIRDYYYSPPEGGEGFKMMDLGDCIHLATASLNSVKEFHTRDNDKRKGKVPLLDLYTLYGDTKLCAKYDLKICSPEADQGGLYD